MRLDMKRKTRLIALVALLMAAVLVLSVQQTLP